MIKNKAGIAQVNEALDKKVDKTFMDSLIERINKIEELAAAAKVVAEKKNVDTESSEEENEEMGLAGVTSAVDG